MARTARSNPATFTGLFDEIRKVFAGTREAKQRGFGVSRFSFNVKGGRCEHCQGHGVQKIEMSFLPDLYVPCEECHGARFNMQTLRVKFKGHSIADILDMRVDDAVDFFENFSNVSRLLVTLQDVGLGYLPLGQASTTLSGGEAQRIKLATELARVDTGKTLYLLDEPTTGLHFVDIQRLLAVLNRLVEKGNTVVVIEHNLDVIKSADWIIDLGPDGGDAGGSIVATGTPGRSRRSPRKLHGPRVAGSVEMKPSRETIFDASGLNKTYDMGDVKVHALRGIDLKLYSGEFVVLLGPSGSGKSTLLNILGGLDVPTSGSVRYLGQELTDYDDLALTRFRRDNVGFVFQFYNLIPSLTARENVALITDIAKDPMKPAEALDMVGLKDRMDHFPAQMSGGEQQRVAIARAIAKRPSVLLCDEPTGALDIKTGIVVLEVIDLINRDLGTTTAVITHNAAISDMANRVVSLSDGQIVSIDARSTRKTAKELVW